MKLILETSVLRDTSNTRDSLASHLTNTEQIEAVLSFLKYKPWLECEQYLKVTLFTNLG